MSLVCACVHCVFISRAQTPPPAQPDVTNDARLDLHVDSEPVHSGRQDPQIQQQMDELDRHRQTVQKMSDKIIDLHAKVCITLDMPVPCIAKAFGCE